MPGWTLVDTHPTQGRTFQRPLDVDELGFLWDGIFNGTADNLQHFQLHLLEGSRDAHLFSRANVVRAWVSTKRRYPLVGSTVQGAGATLRLTGVGIDTKVEGSERGRGDGDHGTELASEPHFIVREHDLSVLRPREIVFGQVTGPEEVQQQIAAILDGPRPLSEELLVQLYVFQETGAERRDVFHFMTLMAHCVTDGVANRTFIRCLLDTLARGEGSDSEPDQIPLEERLAMAIPSVDLGPAYLRSLSPARRRWRMAVAVVIFRLRREKRQGGHTLPCRLTRSTPHVPARSSVAFTSLTQTQSTAVLANCRLHGVTFGNAYMPLAQVAMTRVLYRRYLRGEISEEEWTYRRRQPHISGGPLNLRPYLDKSWFDKGGGGEFVLAIGTFTFQLPFMTLGTADREDDRKHVLSDFSVLLTFDRFLHRAKLVKRQATAFFSHPLFFEIARATMMARVQRTRSGLLRRMKGVETANGNGTHEESDKNEVLAVTDIPLVFAHGWSSLGNVDLISPSEYPLPPTHPLSPYSSVSHPAKAGYVTPHSPSLPPSTPETGMTPKIVVEYTRGHLQARPAELYLSAASSRGQLSMYVTYDGNVFEEGVVREWLDEVREAVLWYLGRTHHSRWA